PEQGLLKAGAEGNCCGGGATQGYNSYPRRHGCMRIPASMAMLTHNQIWTAIDRLAARAKLTPSGLARKAGLDPTTFNKSKRVTPEGRPRWPSTESIAKSLQATGVTIEGPGVRPRWPSTESIAKSLQATGVTIDTFVSLINDRGGAATQAVPLIALTQAS